MFILPSKDINMSRKKYTFINPKMLAARVEKEDFDRFEAKIRQQGFQSIQDFMNEVVKKTASGELTIGVNNEQQQPNS